VATEFLSPKSDLIFKRVVMYLPKMVTEQIGAGADYSKIQRVISIIITDYTINSDNFKYHNKYSLADATGVQFTDILEINTLELSKLPENEDGTSLWAWDEMEWDIELSKQFQGCHCYANRSNT